GGDVAVDCAVTAKLLGAEDVKIVYRRTLEEAPGNMSEFKYALELGIGITTNMAPAEIIGDAKKKVKAIAFNGRKEKCPNAGLKLEATTVVFAIGQGAEDVSEFAPVALTEKSTIKTTKTGKTSSAKYFSGGDIANGGKTVVEAVAEGKAAAESIIAYLDKKGVK
ncbi:MAG: FAD-dependent oxidoreductase, partial [Anaerovoracaceae bacterium]